MSILKNKAQALTHRLESNGLIQPAHAKLVEREILEGLTQDGSYQFLEGDHAIQVKTVIRDSSGNVLGVQG